MAEEKASPFLIPFSIIIAGAIIAGALYFKDGNGQMAGPKPENISGIKIEVSKDDHIFGDPKSPITVVEFSDTECPFCKNFHSTLVEVLPEYEGRVAWVYRHLPLTQLHKKAEREAQATECAEELGGNEGFWNFTNKLFEVTPSNDGLLDSQLPEIAKSVGLDDKKFLECLNSGKMAERVNEDYTGAVAVIQKFVELGLARGVGTPFSVIINDKGEAIAPIGGAVDATTLRRAFDGALDK